MAKFHSKYLLLIIFLFISCKAYKTGHFNELQDENSYLNNIIIDYYHHSEYIKQYKAFRITLEKEDNSAYFYSILPEVNKWPASFVDTIGSFPKYFPTNFKEFKGKLFIWNDQTKPISQTVLTKMDEFKKLDSFWIKISLGMIDEMSLKKEDYPIEIWDDAIKLTYYLIPKSNLKHFKRCKKMNKCKL